MKILFGAVLILLLSQGCIVNNRKCIRKRIDQQRFWFMSPWPDSKKTYLHFNGNIVSEYNDSSTIAQNEIVWKTCTNYFIVTKDTLGPLKRGDTLEMNIIKYNQDTLIIAGTGKGITFPMTFVKLKQ